MAPLASLAVLLAYQVHQMFPLMAENGRSSQMRSLLEMQGQILKAAATEQGQSVLQGKETQSSNSTCISPGCSHKTERIVTQVMSSTTVWFATWPAWETFWTRQCMAAQSSSPSQSTARYGGGVGITFSGSIKQAQRGEMNGPSIID